ncbi:MAG: hypothetical protein KTR25_11435 [Myxococcales bacterium]|nr:hypothetical protein [Myxococcales bacterium]
MRSTAYSLIACLGVTFVFLGLTVKTTFAQFTYSIYELERVRRALSFHDLILVEEKIEGQPICFLRFTREEVFAEDEIWPTWGNRFHWQTQERTIRRELLIERGEPYDQKLIEESMRNLRSLGIFALVRIVPVRDRDSGNLGLLVYTRDIWSLRVESDVQFNGSVLDQALVQLNETNLFGLQKSAVLRFRLLPDVYSLGQSYRDYRLGGARYSLVQSFDLIINRQSDQIEGSQGRLTLSRPFYNLAQHWSYGLVGNYDNRIIRQLRAGRVDVWDAPQTAEIETIPRAFDQHFRAAQAFMSYRHGKAFRQTFGIAVDYRDRSVEPARETQLPDELRSAFAEDILPRARRQLGPRLSYTFNLPNFVVLQNLGSYGQSENIRLGPSISLSVRTPLKAFGSSVNALVVNAGLGFITTPKGGLIEISASGGARYEDNTIIDQVLSGTLRGATPVLGFVRLAGRITWTGRQNDTSQSFVTLGGDNGLRGYPSQDFRVVNGNRLLANIEARSLPLTWQALHFGLIAFYDVGSVYTQLSSARLHHAVGLGLRVLVPQFQRYPSRLDVGLPLGPTRIGTPVLSGGAGQALPLTATEDLLSL